MAINTGVNTSNLTGFVLLGQQPGVDVTNLTGFVLLSGINVTPPIWGSIAPPNGTVSIPYSYTWDMPTSAPTVTYAVTAGSLPPGLSIVAVAGNVAKLAGTPTTSGTYAFTITATNAYGSSDLPCSVTISTIASGNYGFIS